MSDKRTIEINAVLRRQIAQTIVKWCIANGEEFFPNPLADKIIETLKAVSLAQPVEPVCPNCHSVLVRDDVDIGVGMQYSPWRCDNCSGWEAQPVELDQISSKNYGADGVGLTHDEIDALAEPDTDSACTHDMYLPYVEPVVSETKESLITWMQETYLLTCDQARDLYTYLADHMPVQEPKTDAIEAAFQIVFYFIGYVNDTFAKYKLEEYEAIIDRARAQLAALKGRKG
jgi:hypothetical protein